VNLFFGTMEGVTDLPSALQVEVLNPEGPSYSYLTLVPLGGGGFTRSYPVYRHAGRVTASSMIFTSDVCLGAGYVVPADKKIETNDPLLPYFSAASRISFEEYFDEFLLPYLQSRESGMTKEKALAACTLSGLGSFLRTADNVYVIGNEDDPILNEREVQYLKEAFGERGVFFPHGGHCGNLQYLEFAQKLLELIRK